MSGTPSQRLGRVDSIPPGHGFCFIVGDEEVAVYRQRDGRLFATQNRCPHRAGPLAEGVLGGGMVVCPLHSHMFDLATGQGVISDERLRTYEVREVDGEIVLSLPSPAESP